MGKTKAVTKADKMEVAQTNTFSATDQVTLEDIQISRLKIGQPNSDAVKEDRARAGAIYDKDTLEELAYKEEKPLKFVILASKKSWLTEENGEYSVTPALNRNEKPWEQDGVKNTFFHSFFILLPDEIEKDGFAIPYELNFSSTGLQTASIISKYLLKMKMGQMPSWGYTFEGIVTLKKKGQHSWFGMDVTLGKETSGKVMEFASKIPLDALTVDLETPPAPEAPTSEY